MDKEYIILESIDNNSMTTQRELSRKMGISLGSVNMLINKMVKEGLIKIEKLNTNTILYMLTPKGFIEKINKTCKYISIHYKNICEIKEKFKYQLNILSQKGKIYIYLNDDELSKLVEIAIAELNKSDIYKFATIDDLETKSCIIVVLDNERYDYFKSKGYEAINLMELI